MQRRQENLKVAAMPLWINPTTVEKWKWCGSIAELPTGPQEPRSTVLAAEDEAIIVALRAAAAGRLSLCPSSDHPAPDPFVTASPLAARRHHDIGRLLDVARTATVKKAFKAHLDRLLSHIDIAEVQTAKGRLYLFIH